MYISKKISGLKISCGCLNCALFVLNHCGEQAFFLFYIVFSHKEPENNKEYHQMSENDKKHQDKLKNFTIFIFKRRYEEE